jgi:hypothetical protein
LSRLPRFDKQRFPNRSCVSRFLYAEHTLFWCQLHQK